MIKNTNAAGGVRGEYRSRGEALVRGALASFEGRHASAEEVRAYLVERGETIGLTTVYRRLERMEERGEVRRIAGVGGSFCYQYVADGDCSDHYHLYCTVCGRTEHLSCGEIDLLCSHIARDHAFSIDPTRTVLYGRCANCQQIDSSDKGECTK